ncbi:MAG: divalent-cation tolerance protein CutA [bacterium]
MEFIIVFITTQNEEEAVKISRALVQEKLAGCVNIIRAIRSIYRWEGKVEDSSEVLMIVKTRRELFDNLAARVKELHSYTVPEIIALPLLRGSQDYLSWLTDVTKI